MVLHPTPHKIHVSHFGRGFVAGDGGGGIQNLSGERRDDGRLSIAEGWAVLRGELDVGIAG